MIHTEAHHTPAPADKTFLPGPVLLLGAPGVGKGTQAKLLMAEFSIPQISTGDLLRAHRARHTKLGMLAEDLMSQGHLVPDDLVNEMVADRLTEPDAQRGYILDGFPRTLPQADWLDAHLASADSSRESTLPVIAVSINVAYDELLHRITGRRISPAGRIYNIYSNAPKIAGICDVDGSSLVQRTDDSEEVFVERMKTFEALTAPVIEHYRSHGRFEEVDGSQSVEKVSSAITSALKRLRQEQL
ncbi:adenylate kinase [Granulicella arctica]|uniref:Adenylate kinase n=1 Tax=Granulicella arctica TaxID=940613 RepID=A0A7Y9PGB1_9BACT|nr:adenylate kinase [Granulicella arctica]NYF79354.1 adenylate kinase [Granulicella arctica]